MSDKKQRKRTNSASKPKGGGLAAARVMNDQDRKRIRTLLQAKLALSQSYEKELAQVRGAMLGIIEAFDLTAQDANDLLGIHYFAELEPQDPDKAPDGHVHTFDQDPKGSPEKTPEPDPVEGDEVTVG